MNVITLLSGIPASGKSAFVKEHNLEQYTISADAIRLLAGQTVYTLDDNDHVQESISSRNDKYVWNLLYELVDARMARGEFMVVDAQFVTRASQKDLLKLAKKHGYRMNVVDVQGYKDYASILANDYKREPYKQVPDAVTKRQWKKR